MTTEQYIETVEKSLSEYQYLSTGLCPGCAECAETYGQGLDAEEFEEAISTGQVFEEPWFSWNSCEICDTRLGGDRVSGHCVDADGEICHIDGICIDCACYIANGDVPSHGPDGDELTD